MSDEAKLDAIRHARDQRFAEMLVLAVGLAAETHPEMLRKALEGVFDLRAVEAQVRQSMVVLASVQAKAIEVRELVEAIFLDIAELEKRCDALNFRLEKKDADRSTGTSGPCAEHRRDGSGGSQSERSDHAPRAGQGQAPRPRS